MFNLKTVIMKTKKTVIYAIVPAIFFLLLALVFDGCDQNSLYEFEENEYSDYLDLSSYNFEKMSENDIHILQRADQRVGVYKENGIYKLSRSRGIEANMSEKLFNLIKENYDYLNIILAPSLKTQIPRSKSGNPEVPQNTDCVAHAIAHLCGLSVSEVNAVLSANIPGYSSGYGVAVEDLLGAVRLFRPGASEHSSFTVGDNSGIIAIKDHAVNVTKVERTLSGQYYSVYYNDYQGDILGLHLNIIDLSVPSLDQWGDDTVIFKYIY